MYCVRYLLCIVLLYCINGDSAQVLHPYIVSIKLRLREGRIPRLIAESLSGNNPTLSSYFDYSHVCLSDVEELIGASKVNLKDVLKELDIKIPYLYRVPLETLFEIITAAEVDVHRLYSAFVLSFLSDPLEDIPKILDTLNIDKDQFITSVVFGTDEEMLRILLRGRFTKRNIEKVLGIVNQEVKLSEALDFLKSARLIEAFKKINKLNSTIPYLNLLKSSFNSDKVVHLLRYLNVSASDFYQNEAFRILLRNVVESRDELLGSVIGPQQILTNSDSGTLLDYEFLKNYVELVAENVQLPNMEYRILDVHIPNTPSLVALPTVRKVDLPKYLNVTSEIEQDNLNSCAYISYNEWLYSEKVRASFDENGFLQINKTNRSVFRIGSPLVCDGYLYGVADWEYDTIISFIPVHSKIEQAKSRSEKGYLTIVVDSVTEFRSKVMSGICAFLNYLNIYDCTPEFIAGYK